MYITLVIAIINYQLLSLLLLFYSFFYLYIISIYILIYWFIYVLLSLFCSILLIHSGINLENQGMSPILPIRALFEKKKGTKNIITTLYSVPFLISVLHQNMIRRKYGLKEKHIYKALSQTTEKILVNNLKSNYEKYHCGWYFNRRH